MYDAASNSFQSVGSARTAADGTYTIVGLVAKDYTVKTSNNSGYLDKLYNNIPCTSCNTTAGNSVAVTLGNTTGDIDFTLVPGGSGSGVDAVHVWAFPITSSGFGTATFLGAATIGGSRPDVGSILGSQFATSGFWLEGSGLSAGRYRIAAYAHSTVTGTFSRSAYADVTVDVPIPNPVMSIDGPANNSTQSQPFLLGGWAADIGARAGTGIDTIHVYAFNVDTGSVTFVGVASYLRHRRLPAQQRVRHVQPGEVREGDGAVGNRFEGSRVRGC